MIAFITAIAVTPAMKGRLDTARPGEKLSHGVVIPGYEPSWISMPGNERDSDAASAMRYTLRHPLAVAKLGLVRVGVEFAGVRPFYSTPHNIFIGTLLFLIYSTAIFGLVRLPSGDSIQLVIGIISIHVLFVAVAFASYDGRFLLYPLAIVGVFSGAGVTRILGLAGADPSRGLTRP